MTLSEPFHFCSFVRSFVLVLYARVHAYVVCCVLCVVCCVLATSAQAVHLCAACAMVFVVQLMAVNVRASTILT